MMLWFCANYNMILVFLLYYYFLNYDNHPFFFFFFVPVCEVLADAMTVFITLYYSVVLLVS